MNIKKNHRKFVFVMAVTLSFVLFAANTTTVLAADTSNVVSGDVQTVTNSVATSGGTITPYGDLGYYTTKTLVDTAYKSKHFVKYLTSNWVQTDHYDVSEGTSLSFNVGFTYEGVNLTASYTKSVGAGYTVKADPTRWSRLAEFADITIKKYLVKRYTTGGVLVDTYYSYTTITTATYIYPKYQQ